MKLSNNMDRFLEEIKDSLEADYTEFCFYQTKVQETLAVFHEICVKNEITYYLAYGSLLGAIRDNGQIPWDYDIDVWVPFEQSQKLIDALEKDLPETYYFKTRLKDPKVRHNIVRLAPVEYDSEALHVDVFWLTGFHGTEQDRKKICVESARCSRAMLLRYCTKEVLGIRGRVAGLKYILEKVVYAPITDARTDKQFKSMMHPCKGAPRLTDNFYEAEFESDWFGEPRTITVASGQLLYIPQDAEKLLNAMYGDYMKVPEIGTRIEEFRRSLNRIRQIGLCK